MHADLPKGAMSRRAVVVSNRRAEGPTGDARLFHGAIREAVVNCMLGTLSGPGVTATRKSAAYRHKHSSRDWRLNQRMRDRRHCSVYVYRAGNGPRDGITPEPVTAVLHLLTHVANSGV